MKKLLLAFALFFIPALLLAQVYPSIGPNSVLGRLGASLPGPPQAISFQTLANNLLQYFPSIPTSGRTQLSGNLTLYVNGSSGSDSHNGLSPLSPMLTLQHAATVVCNNYDLNGHTVLIDGSDNGTYNGSYAGFNTCNYVGYLASNGQTTVVVRGPAARSSSCTNYLNITSGITSVGVPLPWTITNVQLDAEVDADAMSWIALDGDCFAGNSSGPQVNADLSSIIEFINNPFTIDGASTGGFAQATTNGNIIWQSTASPVTISGSPSMGGQFVTATNGGGIYCQDITFTGSLAANTKRYVIDDTSYITCGHTSVTADPNQVLPGDTTGTGLGTTGQMLVSAGPGNGSNYLGNYIKTLAGASAGASTSNSTQYVGLAGISTSEVYYMLAPAAYTLQSFYVATPTPPGNGNTYTFTLRVGGSNTSVTCQVSGAAAQSCNDTTHTATITAGTALDVQMVSSASASTTQVMWSVGAQ